MLTSALQHAGYRHHAQTGVWVPAHRAMPPFNYSDGDVEAHIYALMDTVSDLSCGSPELAALGNDWPKTYHFSTQRADLLRPLAHLLGGNVLEIGSGCGAITRYLGETAQEVLGLEGSLRRATIARKRCTGLKNVAITCANAMDFATMRRFDAVVLVGVLEYSRCFIAAADPIQAMLAHCRSFLNPGGKLIVAIENQLGLKYFGGAPEDHLNQPFFGINDNYSAKTVVTFGKKELAARLGQAGFNGQRFFYPFPDYKMPATIITQAGADDPCEAMQNVAASLNARTMNLPYNRPFSEERAWPLLLRNGVLDHMANSFLVVAQEASLAQDQALEREPGDLAYIYSTTRRRQFAKETVLRRSGAKVEVERRRLYPDLAPVYEILHQVIENEEATQGRTLSRAMGGVINTTGWRIQDIAQCAKPWVNYLKERKVPGSTNAQGMFDVPGHLIDCSPGNLLVNDDASLKGFDFEWQVQEQIPATWPLFRGMFYTLYNHASIARPHAHVPPRIIEVVQDTMATLGMPATDDDLAELLKLESAFFNASTEAIMTAQMVQRPS